ncbi:plasmid maintenance system antidote protein VapI/Zn-dependent peptidase ImmA (M78 family) [Paenibacillus anaericanus]|uniref:ImmA/IrrE family metallo-endopeptidase n=1 Tax=Paenibacillus anaericanus TaxID=170367 RepID=UPI00277FE63A|nr:ImmA/IrrE family metallo-endopeptidase [Paenibacillus anaericanus]MDQ0090887.1 plasmid maintenance system antidote protein VapI/Zn-dependent peptidase ImmA (M78 family) [Paenibacillus anaericanus]
MGDEFIVHTGSIIKEYLDDIGLSPKECCKQIGISEEYFNNLLNGKNMITEEVANKLEEVIKGIPASYWLNYDNKYREFLNRKEIGFQLYAIDELKSYARRFKFNTVFGGLDWDLTRQAKEMMELLGISSFEQFDTTYSNLNVDFMEDGGEKESIAIWLNLAREEVEIQNKDLSNTNYSKEVLTKSLDKFKLLALNYDYESSLKSTRKLLNRLGIYLVFIDAIDNSKVRGALTTYKENPAIYLSGRFKTHDHIWFALMHEIGHLIKHYTPNRPIISFEDELFELRHTFDTKEEEANEFARDYFIDKSDYKKFVDSNKFDEQGVYAFAQTQNVLPGIVVARLQHDGYIGYEKLNFLKNR